MSNNHTGRMLWFAYPSSSWPWILMIHQLVYNTALLKSCKQVWIYILCARIILRDVGGGLNSKEMHLIRTAFYQNWPQRTCKSVLQHSNSCEKLKCYVHANLANCLSNHFPIVCLHYLQLPFPTFHLSPTVMTQRVSAWHNCTNC